MNRRLGAVVGAFAVAAATFGTVAVPADASPRHAPAAVVEASAPLDDAFYDYTGRKPLREVPLGAVLKRRTVSYSIQGLALPIKAVQLLYRTKNAVGRPVVNVTTVVRPLVPILDRPKVVSYQSFYDSLDPADQPSAQIAGGHGVGGLIANAETLLFAPLLLAGYTINIPDTEGQDADFAAGPEYGMTTLDSLRAISRAPVTGVRRHTPIGLIGYSGGAIASEWAAELAPTYAPRVSERIVGTAIGGVLVHPGHNLHYIDGSLLWSGVLPMALVGLSRAYNVDLGRYASAYGKSVLEQMRHVSITAALGRYPGLTWAELAKPRYQVPEKVGPFVRIANRLIMSTGGTPTAPMFIGQGTAGDLEGTPGNKPGIGKGDGVMIAGDVRTLARRYCSRGVVVQHKEYAGTHVSSTVQWLPQAYGWLTARFRGETAPSSCGSIPPGNSLAPLKRQ